MPQLSVNIDHIATLRQARGGREPDPIQAAVLAELAGAHGITAHLREDRRHIQDRDIYLLKQTVTTRLNLEMAPVSEIIHVALDVMPAMVTIVPEKREERTTESGYPVRGKEKELEKTIESMHENNILVSIFIDPDIQQIKAAKKVGAACVELHTGTYAEASGTGRLEELERLRDCALAADKLGLRVNAGHGLNYANVGDIADIEPIEDLNIGHAVIARAALTGMDTAVRDMLSCIG